MPNSSASSCPGTTLAEKPPETPAKAAASPAIGGGVEHGRQRDQDDIGRIRREVGHHRDQGYRRGQQNPRGAAHAGAHRGGKEPGALGDARAEHDNDDVAQGVEAGEGRGHLDEEKADVVRGEQAHRRDPERASVGRRLRRMIDADAERRQNRARDDEDGDEPEEDEHRIGQRIAGALDPAEHAAPSSVRRRRFRHDRLRRARRGGSAQQGL
jgi:hypothetical protein